ncbi:MAG: PD-(D/E)XK nuclease family protein [Bacteroidaceae bacterium]|nr:PD-(D/E)XK nuclease family protein [Bacteroidaceae bacterium]
MTPFLQTVARHLYAGIKDNSEGLTIIFPNKRAGLFFNKYLRQELEGYVWAPQYVTIDEVFRKLSSKQVADPIELVCRLYRVYLKVTGRTESLDRFYSWGETMLRDFEDIDNSMARADKLLSNVKELEDLKDFDFLSEGQREALRTYFDHYMKKEDTELKQKFSAIWEYLLPIYEQFREELAQEGLAYMGMLKREVVESLDDSVALKGDRAGLQAEYFEGRRFVVVGFNVLSPTEQRLFLAMKQRAKVTFYWDYDLGYTNWGEADDKLSTYEAGQFIKENVRIFGNALDTLSDAERDEVYNNFCKPKQITYVETATETQQTRYVDTWLQNTVKKEEDMIRTAVVLCNERNLQPLLHAIPNTFGNDEQMLLNVTMGYPLGETPIVSFLLALAELQLFGRSGSDWRYQYVLAVLNHPYAGRLDTEEVARLRERIEKDKLFYPTDADLKSEGPLQVLFQPTGGNTALLQYLAEAAKAVGMTFKNKATLDGLDQLYCESVFSAYTLLNRLISLSEIQIEGSEAPLFDVQGTTLLRLLRSLLQQKSIPFHGEPAEGVQILGLLETRLLDFENVILLSANDDFLPGTPHRASFIPYNLREAYGMTTIEKQVALSAYYFYRLLSRAKNISLLYNASADGLQTGEMSRFLSQLLAEVGVKDSKKKALLAPETKPAFYSLTTQSEATTTPTIEVEKTEEVLDRLCDRFDTLNKEKPRYLSPSAINTYLNCPLQFYLQYVVGVSEDDELTEDVDSRHFGTLFHECMEQIYKPYKGEVVEENGKLWFKPGREVTKQELEAWAKDDLGLDGVLSYAFAKVFFNVKDEEKRKNFNLRLNGEQEINRLVIKRYVENQLRYDAALAPFRILGLEETVKHVVEVQSGTRKVSLLLGGIIDRWDEIDWGEGKVQRILDYKTSQSRPNSYPTVEDIFDTSREDMFKYTFQTFYYSYVVDKVLKETNVKLMPALMYIKLASYVKGKVKSDADANAQRKVYAEEMGVRIKELVEKVKKTKDGETKKMGYESHVVTDYFNDPAKEFEQRLMNLLAEIFSPEVPFRQTSCKKHCAYCNFLKICGRKVEK